MSSVNAGSSLSSSNWSSHARKYNNASGQALTMPMLRAAFTNHFYTVLDEQARGCSKEKPLEVLALCGGTGPETILICERLGDRVKVLSTDTAQGMVDVCSETIKQAGYAEIASARVMDAMQIDAPDNSFDAVFLILGPMLLPDPNQCFEHVARVLKPNGRFYTLTPGTMDTHDFMTDSKRDVLIQSGEQDRFRNMYAEMFLPKWGTPEALARVLNESGVFTHVEAYSDHSIVPLDSETDVDDILERLYDNPGMEMMYTRDLTPDQKRAWKDAVRTRFLSKCNVGLSVNANCAWASCS